jgi:hypothetical protein
VVPDKSTPVSNEPRTRDKEIRITGPQVRRTLENRDGPWAACLSCSVSNPNGFVAWANSMVRIGRRGRQGNGMADCDVVTAHEDLLHQQSYDSLTRAEGQ